MATTSWKLGNGRLSACYRKNRAWFNIIFVPYTLIFFTFLPLVVLLDIIFGKADLLFVSPEVLKERGSPDKPLFGYFRKRIHTKVLRVIMHHWSQLVFAITLYLVVQNPNKTEENRMAHWYNYLAGFFSLFLLFDGLRSLNVRRKNVSQWALQSIFTQILLLAGGVITLVYHSNDSNKDIDRADISGNHPISIAETFIAAAVWMAYFRFYFLFLLRM